MIQKSHHLIILVGLAGCLGPRSEDVTSPQFVLPAGSAVPSVADNPELVTQIRAFDGLNDATLMMSNGVIVRGTGKATDPANPTGPGVPVRFWNFGPVPLNAAFAVKSAVYVISDANGDGTFTPRPEHPWLIPYLPGDVGYGAIHQIFYVPVTPAYAGELVTSFDALSEAIELGLVTEPVSLGQWRNLPVVPPDTTLEVDTDTAVPPIEVYGRGYRVTAFALGGALGVQPLRTGLVPIGQESRLLSGVVAPDGTLPTTPDPQPVLQYGVPSEPPAMAFNYTPVVTELDVRLASGVAPSAIDKDADLFVRNAMTGAITGQVAATVDDFVVTTTVTNRQLQFEVGSP